MSLHMNDFQLCIRQHCDLERMGEGDLAQAREIRWMDDAHERRCRRDMGDTDGNMLTPRPLPLSANS